MSDAATVFDVKLMTLPETAERARITTRTLMAHIAGGTGPTVTKLGGRALIRDDHFLAWLDANARQGNAAR